MKNLIYNPEVFIQAIKNWPEMIKHFEDSKQYSAEQLLSAKRGLQFLSENIDENSIIDKPLFTIFASTVFNLLLMNETGVLFAFKSKSENEMILRAYSIALFRICQWKRIHTTMIIFKFYLIRF
ncbi:MAG: hypothetical protein IPF75_15295 [Bacteroidetes bacterium]|nr:hypothetical protein [Bacteroidota bacterium]